MKLKWFESYWSCINLCISPCSGLTAIATYLLTSELWSRGAGLFAACFIAIVPGYSSRSVAGSYDNEGIAIFALQFTYYLWLKSVKSGSIFWSVCTALSYFYMVRVNYCPIWYNIGQMYMSTFKSLWSLINVVELT